MCEFVRDSMPDRRRQRYGDMEYDWEHRVDTTSGTTGWRERLLGLFHSPYQPTDAEVFREMMASVPITFCDFTFVDVGSGKGRTLLLASEYPFQKIIGIELMEELHRVAQNNIRAYQNPTQLCRQILSLRIDACDYEFPPDPLLVYLFNPLPERTLVQLLNHLTKSQQEFPRPLWLVYHNPALERVLASYEWLERTGWTEQYSVYRSRQKSEVRNLRSV